MTIVNSALIGLENLVYSKLLNEAINSYEVPVAIAPAINAKIKPKVNSAILYGDNKAVETVSALGEIEVELETTDLPLEVFAVLLGHSLDAVTGVITYNSADVAPYVALGFKAKKANGKYRYIWLLKGKFEEQEDEYATTEDKVKFTTPKIKGTFVSRIDNNWKYTADEDSGTVPANFLSSVYEPVA